MSSRASVIVPIEQGDPRLPDCLESLRAQTFDELEVVLVDRSAGGTAGAELERDGLPDGFKVVSATEPTGAALTLDEARHLGIRESGGDYVMFADPGEIYVKDAVARLVRGLDKTGSDFACGNAHVRTDKGAAKSPLHNRALGRARTRTHIGRDRDLCYDVSITGKLFRREFWERAGLAFVGGRHADLGVTLSAHLMATSVDVLDQPVCTMARAETKPAFDARDVTDAFTAAATVLDLVAHRTVLPTRSGRRLRHWYDQAALGTFLKRYLDASPDADEELRGHLVEQAAAYLTRTGVKALDDLPAMTRLKWYLAYRGFTMELVKVVRFERGKTNAEIVRRRGRRYVRYPYFTHEKMAIPRWIYRAGSELNLRSKIHAVRWEDGRLVVEGEAHIHSFSERRRWQSVKTFALRQKGSRRILLAPARTRRKPGAAEGSDPYEWAGFSFGIDAKRLKGKGDWADATWTVAAGVVNTGVFRHAKLRGGGSGSAAHPPYHYVAEDVRIVPEIADGGLRVRVETVRAKATGCRWADGELIVEGVLRGPVPKQATLRLTAEGGPKGGGPKDGGAETGGAGRGAPPVVSVPLTLEARSGGTTAFEARVPVAELFGADTTSGAPAGAPVGEPPPRMVEVVSGKQAVRLVMAEGLADARLTAGDVERVAGRTWDGYLELAARPVRPVVTGCDWQQHDGVLVLEGDHPALDGSQQAELVLRLRGRRQEHGFAAAVDGARFRVEVPVSAVVSVAGTLPLRAGTWDVLFRRQGVDAEPRPVELDRDAVSGFPAGVEIKGRKYTLDHHRYDRLLLGVGNNVRPEEAHGQRKLWEAARAKAAREGLRDAVLFISYNGKQYSDSPRAIHEELVRRGSTLEQLWEVNDDQVELPGTLTAVRRRGAEWYDALASSRYIVTNVRMSEFFERRPDQVLIQAWHGTPLKKIGRDVKEVHFSYAPGMATVKKKEGTKKAPAKPPEWSHLISPNRFSTEIFKRAFKGSYGELLEVGFPRNDLMYSPDVDKIAAGIRDRIGLPAGKRVVLYTPTWRDDQYYGRGRYKFDLQLDLAAAKERLGDDHVLLIRPHSNVVDAVPGAGDGFVWDVSAYPDVNDLFLIADVMITDYSSVLFDYVNTGRPILFFTYDLEHYRDVLRGFYFDFEADAPGPLLRTSDEVIDALADIDRVAEKYQEAYGKFTARFCDLDDGNAAGRTIDQAFDKI